MQANASESQVLFKIEHNDKVGRYAVASCDFNPGDVIFTETPFAFGPKADSPPVCLGCCIPVNVSTFCSSCKWPVCNNKCQEIPAHKYAECSLFSKNKVQFQSIENPELTCLQYECITPLRILLAIKANPERWEEEVKMMESHNNKRKSKPIWRFNQINIVNYLRGPCKLDFDEELIHTVCGILESNAFEARSISGHPIRCLFPKLAILSHNCVSNISHSIVCTGSGDDQDFSVTVRAATKVCEGDELFSSYTYSFWPTLTRREFLKESKYFDCSCARCSDPTELGTHMSTIRCNQCTTGFLTSTNSLDNNAPWKCSNCNEPLESSHVKNLFIKIQQELDAADNSHPQIRLKLLEALLRKYEKILHPQNSYCCILRSSLIDMCGKLKNNCELDLIERKKDYCEQLLKVVDVIEPGYTRTRGVTLHELFISLVFITVNETEINKNELIRRLQEILEILEESTNILKLEPESTFEGKIGIFSKMLFQQLKEHFDDVVHGRMELTNVLYFTKK
ncbi:hypothetical protein ILUMI_04907 [Ignelater luminosus]|uniref:SET domain-containing protein n=1 Tax=Ignelater luminosus TaxID=2038154 RepID=A0A8K0DIR7_IGNLU|nr:hypothetical protein ILUMI_04907 [Ignelater luminosus]